MSALPTDSRRFWPPDRRNGCTSRADQAEPPSRSSTRRSISASSTPRIRRPCASSSWTVWAMNWCSGFWKTKPMWAAIVRTSLRPGRSRRRRCGRGEAGPPRRSPGAASSCRRRSSRSPRGSRLSRPRGSPRGGSGCAGGPDRVRHRVGRRGPLIDRSVVTRATGAVGGVGSAVESSAAVSSAGVRGRRGSMTPPSPQSQGRERRDRQPDAHLEQFVEVTEQDVASRAVEGECPVAIEDDDPVDEVDGGVEVVLDEQDRAPLPGAVWSGDDARGLRRPPRSRPDRGSPSARRGRGGRCPWPGRRRSRVAVGLRPRGGRGSRPGVPRARPAGAPVRRGTAPPRRGAGGSPGRSTPRRGPFR